LDMNLAYITKFGKNKLTFQLDVFNILNTHTAAEVNEVRDYSRATTSKNEGRLNQNWLSPSSFQEPRSVRLTARYEY
jgi:hypothetical protein